MTFRKSTSLAILAFAALATAGTGAALAQGMGRGPGRSGPGPLCRSQESFVPRIAARLETTLRPTDAQKADFEALKQALTKAEATLKASCPTEAETANQAPPARLALAEKRMAAGLEALRTVRPAVDTLYAKLDDRQRDALRWMPRGPMFAGMMMGGPGHGEGGGGEWRGHGEGRGGGDWHGGPRNRGDAPRP